MSTPRTRCCLVGNASTLVDAPCLFWIGREWKGDRGRGQEEKKKKKVERRTKKAREQRKQEAGSTTEKVKHLEASKLHQRQQEIVVILANQEMKREGVRRREKHRITQVLRGNKVTSSSFDKYFRS